MKHVLDKYENPNGFDSERDGVAGRLFQVTLYVYDDESDEIATVKTTRFEPSEVVV